MPPNRRSGNRSLTSCAWRVAALWMLAIAAACSDSPAGPEPAPDPDRYTEEEISYFAEIAFGAEYGASGTPLLRRWAKNPLVRVHGTPTAADETALTQVIADINALTRGVRLERTDGPSDIDLYVVPQADFLRYEPNYVPGNRGFVWIWWNGSQQIIRGRILVASDIDQNVRAHLIREELTQSLGLLKDSHRYPQSIFYQAASVVQSFAPIDRTVIEMLYRPELVPGMTEAQAVSTLRQVSRSTASASEAAARQFETARIPGSGGSGVQAQ